MPTYYKLWLIYWFLLTFPACDPAYYPIFAIFSDWFYRLIRYTRKCHFKAPIFASSLIWRYTSLIHLCRFDYFMRYDYTPFDTIARMVPYHTWYQAIHIVYNHLYNIPACQHDIYFTTIHIQLCRIKAIRSTSWYSFQYYIWQHSRLYINIAICYI